MSDAAVGIHTDPTFKLGLRPAQPAVRALELGDFLTGVLPQYPDHVDYLKGISYGMYLNNRYGICGPTAVCNSRRMVTAFLEGQMQAPSQEACEDLYRRSGNPNFPADDNGVIMQQMLQEVLRGGIDGVKCVAFARVNISKLDELDAAIAIFGNVLFGVNLQAAQQSQLSSGVWDYAPSGPWGGHAVMGGAFGTQGGNDVITWEQRVRMTDRFIRQQGLEAWVVLWPEHLRQKQFLQSVDIWAMASAYEALTGKKFPAPLPPKPAPGPTPVTPPSGGWSITITGTGPKPHINVLTPPVAPGEPDDELPPLEP